MEAEGNSNIRGEDRAPAPPSQLTHVQPGTLFGVTFVHFILWFEQFPLVLFGFGNATATETALINNNETRCEMNAIVEERWVGEGGET
jgi:hypothetical protein